jgi:hypothetical protein
VPYPATQGSGESGHSFNPARWQVIRGHRLLVGRRRQAACGRQAAVLAQGPLAAMVASPGV